ncbi:MAG: NAD(P)H-hydrate dehydratase [Peptococcaceae bacterium]|nr:NAD(P)H-hydrate dehydratase [Peptococcaceae bacterium]
MYLVSNEEMRALDRSAIEEWQIPSLVLMENAGIAIMRQLENDVADLYAKRITILCGCGNNGGDGLVLARQLYLAGAENVTVAIVIAGERRFSTDHQVNRNILDRLPIKLIEVDGASKLNVLKAQLNFTDVAVDCLFGTGLSRELDTFLQQVIEVVNDKRVLRVSVDIPSGLGGDDGNIYGAAIRADYTYTLAWPKQGLFVGEAAAHLGTLRVLPIGIPNEVAEQAQVQGTLLEPTMLAAVLPKRALNSHKNSYGHVGLIAGSVGMSGACVLAARAAMRSGAGLVTALIDKGIYTAAAAAAPEVMMKPVAWPNQPALDWLLGNTTVQLIGPGMGKSEEKKQTIYSLLRMAEGTVVIDADALSMIGEGDGTILKNSAAQCILTPHPGEMARLLGLTSAEVQADRMQYARRVAERFHCVVVLKGHNTIIAAPDGRYAINPCDSVALATAGSGDVLAGVIAAFAAQGMEAYDAACMGVLAHGMAGMRLAQTRGAMATVASDIIDSVGEVLRAAMQD